MVGQARSGAHACGAFTLARPSAGARSEHFMFSAGLYGRGIPTLQSALNHPFATSISQTGGMRAEKRTE
jgi:hypothetical protein